MWIICQTGPSEWDVTIETITLDQTQWYKPDLNYSQHDFLCCSYRKFEIRFENFNSTVVLVRSETQILRNTNETSGVYLMCRHTVWSQYQTWLITKVYHLKKIKIIWYRHSHAVADYKSFVVLKPQVLCFTNVLKWKPRSVFPKYLIALFLLTSSRQHRPAACQRALHHRMFCLQCWKRNSPG